MHIAMIGPFGLHPKGTMRARALPAARALARRGHRVTLVMPPWHTPLEAGRDWADAESGVALVYVSLSGLRLPLLGHGLVAARMAGRVRRLGVDAVHAFKPKAYSHLTAALLRLPGVRRGLPLLVMDTDDWEGPGGWNDLEPYGAVQRRVFAWQERSGLRAAARVTVASRQLQSLAWSLGVPRADVTYVPNALDGLPPDSGPERSRRGDREPPRILLYTRFFEFDLERPLEVLSLVRRHMPSTRLIVAGRGLFGEEERFLAMAASRGLAGAVEHLGWVDGDETWRAFARSDVALYPFDDTLVNRAKSPVKLLELLGAGIPVVGDAVGEVREAIVHPTSGLLVPAGDVEAMARAVVDLLGDRDRRLGIGLEARRRVGEAFLWEHRAPELEAIYDRPAGRTHEDRAR